MQKRKWYRKKRTWLFFLFLLYLIAIRLEWAKFRYRPEKLKQSVFEQTKIQPLIQQKEFEGKSIQYIQVGQSVDAPLVVFIHGSPGSLADYRVYLSDPGLSKAAVLLSIDRPGFGYSDFGNVESRLSVQASAIASVLESFQNEKIILVGYSLGGPVAVKTAIDYPELIDGVVLIAPSISPDLEPANTWRKVLNWKIFQWLAPVALTVCNQEIIPLRAELELMLEGWKNINVPVTIIQGEKDQLVPKGNAGFAKKMLTGSSSVEVKLVEDANHFILWAEPQLIKATLLELIRKVE